MDNDIRRAALACGEFFRDELEFGDIVNSSPRLLAHMTRLRDLCFDVLGDPSTVAAEAIKASAGAYETWASCPITGRPFFMNLEHPEMGEVPTFGGPFDSYTIPEVDEDGDLCCERYDHDAGAWVEGGEPLNVYLTTEQPCNHALPAWIARSREPEAACPHLKVEHGDREIRLSELRPSGKKPLLDKPDKWD